VLGFSSLASACSGSAWMRWSAVALALAVALWLQLGEFRLHVTGMMP